MNEAQHSRNIDNRHNLRAAAGHVNPRLVRRNRHAKRLRGVALQLIQRHFNGLAHVRAKHRERILERTAVLKVRQRHKTFGMVLGHHAQPPIA